LFIGNITAVGAYASGVLDRKRRVMKMILTILTYIEASADAYVESKLCSIATRVEKR